MGWAGAVRNPGSPAPRRVFTVCVPCLALLLSACESDALARLQKDLASLFGDTQASAGATDQAAAAPEPTEEAEPESGEAPIDPAGASQAPAGATQATAEPTSEPEPTEPLPEPSATARAARPAPAILWTGYQGLEPSPSEVDVLFHETGSLSLDGYDKLLIEPVTVGPVSPSRYTALTGPERESMGQYFRQALREQLAKSYAIVAEPGFGVLRIRATITDVSAQAELPEIRAHTPATYVQAKLRRMAKREISSIEAAVAIEVLDSATGEPLADLMDRRTGREAMSEFDPVWVRIRPALDYWAARLRAALASHVDGAAAPGHGPRRILAGLPPPGRW